MTIIIKLWEFPNIPRKKRITLGKTGCLSCFFIYTYIKDKKSVPFIHLFLPFRNNFLLCVLVFMKVLVAVWLHYATQLYGVIYRVGLEKRGKEGITL